MSNSEPYEKLSAMQIVARILSVITCGGGVAACIYSLSLQIQEVGNLVASVCWFTGLGTAVAAIAGYVVTCGPEYKNRVPAAVVAIAMLALAAFFAERAYLWVQAVIAVTLALLVIETVLLIVYHQILRRADPLAQ